MIMGIDMYDNVTIIFYQCITDAILISFNKLKTLNKLYNNRKNLYRYYQIIRNRVLNVVWISVT